ncbi:unnamed protein product [Amoebophrya sp. A25]|nr:unnamed protein product [Amoebophrya sp. A25]|eukprot:GSA25T00004141001.1
MVLLPKKRDRVSRHKLLGGFFLPKGPSMQRQLSRFRNQGSSRTIPKGDGPATSLALQFPVTLKSSSRTSIFIIFSAVLVLLVAFAVVSPSPLGWFRRN